MKRVASILAVVAAFAFHAPAWGAAVSPALRVGTFNIRCATGNDKGGRSWNSRCGGVVELIRRMKCDIIGLQEVTPKQMKYLQSALGGEYGIIGVFRERNLKSGEAVPVCFLKSRFDLLKTGTFWLSAHPDTPGSRDWGAAFPRNCTWVLLRDRVTKKTICFANTHPDHKSGAARLNGAKVIANRLERVREGAPVVLVGDHNCNDNDAPAVFLRGMYDDAMHVTRKPPKGPWRSFSGWRKVAREVPATEALRLNPNDREHGRTNRIDFIYVSKKNIAVLGYVTIGMVRKGADEFYSDHFPVMAKILLR